MPITENEIEEAAIEILQDLGYSYLYGLDIAPDGSKPERASWSDVVLVGRLRSAIEKINPKLPESVYQDAVKKVLRSTTNNVILNNQRFHDFIVNGVTIEHTEKGQPKNYILKLLHDDPQKNDFVAANQVTIIEGRFNRRPDVIIFINGLPIAVLELKNSTDEKATIWSAYNQFQTYKEQIPSLFDYNELLVISDGTEARVGTIGSSKEWFLPWKSIDGETIVPNSAPQLQTLLEGMFRKDRIIDIIKHFIVFSKTKKETIKILAGYHQYFATNKAIESSYKATVGNRKAGVVWHTQGSGKSLTMVFYSGKLILSRKLENPTIVVITDRNDLDDQLFRTFSACSDLLRQKPVQASDKKDLKEKLKVASGGVIFTTIQKFQDDTTDYPLLSERKNIIVIADEAHRSQYGFKAKVDKDTAEISYGFAKYLRDAIPNASFIGFTGTPIDFEDKSTRAIFGNYIDIYDIEQAVNDERTVKIYYESRLAKIDLLKDEMPHLDEDIEEITEDQEEFEKERTKSKWSQLEAVVGSEKRIKLIAKDIVTHFEARDEINDGKAMIVCMSRRICIDLHNAIVKLRPKWYSKDDDKGILKIIMTGSASDKTDWQEHIRTKNKRKELGDRFKDPSDPFKIVIVRDMWLTGFDVPSLHTMYIDKPMKGHTLMQSIARVNRVFKNKQGGLIVDYLGIAYELKKALSNYTKSGGKGKPTVDQKEAVALMLKKYEIILGMFYGFDYSAFFKGTAKQKLALIPEANAHILEQEKGKERFVKHVVELTKAFSLAVPHEEALKIRDELGFFQAVKAALTKFDTLPGKTHADIDTAIKQLISRAIASDTVIDVFKAAGLDKPEISVLSDTFLDEVKGMKHKNLAFETLKKLLNDEIKVRFRHNKIQSKRFSEMLEETIKKYQNRSITSAQVIQELIEIARQVREAKKRGEELDLTEEELAFYDALAKNEKAVQELGSEILKKMARELTELIRQNTSIDWTQRESIQAKLRAMVKRLLKRYGYPPDKTKMATDLVLDQAKRLSDILVEDDDISLYVSETMPALAVAEKCKEYREKKK